MLRLCRFFRLVLIETVINHQDEEGFTPLMWAAAHGQIAVVEFLLQNVRKARCLSRSRAIFIFQQALLLISRVVPLCAVGFGPQPPGQREGECIVLGLQ